MHFDCFPKVDIKTTTCDEATNFSSLDDKTLTRARPIRLYPTQEQRTTLLKWFEAYRKTYNLAIKYQRKLEFNKANAITSFQTLKKYLKTRRSDSYRKMDSRIEYSETCS